MGDSREKSVIVIVDNDVGDDPDNFEIDFVSTGQESSPDLDLIQKKLLAKSESVKNCTQVSDIVFKKQSKIREGVWVVMRKESPVKSGSIIQCSFKSKKQLAFTSEKKDTAVDSSSKTKPVNTHVPLQDTDGNPLSSAFLVNSSAAFHNIIDNHLTSTSISVETPGSSHASQFVVQKYAEAGVSGEALEDQLILIDDTGNGSCGSSSTDIVYSSCDEHSLLSSNIYQNMTPAICSRAALELLPYLDPGKGRGDKAARYLVDSRLESANLEESIRQEPRTFPRKGQRNGLLCCRPSFSTLVEKVVHQ